MLKSAIKAIGCALLLLQAAFPAFADTWPSRPIKLVVPYPPGGSSDITARVIAESLRPLLAKLAQQLTLPQSVSRQPL